jgi:hypothetical protein
MKFKKGDKLTWELFLEACKEVDNVKETITEGMNAPMNFSSIEDAEQYYRSIGGITVEEFKNKMKEMYGY